jgi:hypothetical protein
VGEERKTGQKAASAETVTASAKQDAKSRIQQLAKALGNDEIAKRISDGNATRDQMLAFVTERLGVMEELQRREIALTAKSADYNAFPRELDPKDLAEPKRWKAAAEAYDQAVSAICRGDLRRGQDLLERAQKVEEQTVERMSRLVDTNEAWRAGQLDGGVLATLVGQTPTSGSCGEPPEIRARLDRILAVEQTMPELPVHKRDHDPWWTEEEEEDQPDGEGA